MPHRLRLQRLIVILQISKNKVSLHLPLSLEDARNPDQVDSFSLCVFLFQINSDKINYTTIFYYLEGPGVDQPPIGTFGIDRRTGFVKIYSILDREKISSYKVRALKHFLQSSPPVLLGEDG